MKLRDYQQKIICDVKQSIVSGNRQLLLVMQTGAGKTHVASSIIQAAADKRKRVLFIMPRRQLVYQSIEKLQEYGVNHGVIMAGEQKFNMPLVQVASFDTLYHRAVKNQSMNMPEADLIIVDEAHACYTKARLEMLRLYPKAVVIGLTATPALANGKGMGGFYKDIVESLSMKEMVEREYLVPMRYFAPSQFDLDGIKLNKDGDYQDKALNAAVDTPKLVGDIYLNWKRIASDRTTIIFCVSRAHARHVCQEFCENGVNAEYLDGDTDTEERAAIIHRVTTGKTQVIVNIFVMTYGVDIPKLDCVVLARPTKSISNYLQMVGRGSRLSDGKDDCIVIDHGGVVEELGFVDDEQYWSLDDKKTVKERKQEAKEDAKEAKEIKCGDCGTLFKARHTCPTCGHEMIKEGEALPVHEADLSEIKRDKTKPADKERFYAMLLHHSNEKGYKRGWGDWKFREKFGHFPAKKNGVNPIQPDGEMLRYLKYLQIKGAKRVAA